MDPNHPNVGDQLILASGEAPVHTFWTIGETIYGEDTCVLFNDATGLVAYAALPPENGRPVVLAAAPKQIDGKYAPDDLGFVGRQVKTSGYDVVDGTCVAFQTFKDSGQNLDATGNTGWKVGTPIITWGWGGGDPGKIWYVVGPLTNNDT